MGLRAAPPIIRTWYSLTLVMVGQMTSGSCLTPAMFMGQSESSNTIDVSIHLWWGAAFDVGAAAVIVRRSILTTRLDVVGVS
jgi:hypothetical protein